MRPNVNTELMISVMKSLHQGLVI